MGALSDACHSGRWAACPDFCFWDAPLMELSGKTMGIIGYGTIGRAVGAIAQALGMVRGSYQGDRTATRGELAAMLCRLLERQGANAGA